MEDDLSTLVDDITQHLGFCSISPADRIAIVQAENVSARQFALMVLRAEGVRNPENELSLLRRLTTLFVEHFGTDSMSVKTHEA
jgi:hypothetical protein